MAYYRVTDGNGKLIVNVSVSAPDLRDPTFDEEELLAGAIASGLEAGLALIQGTRDKAARDAAERRELQDAGKALMRALEDLFSPLPCPPAD